MWKLGASDLRIVQRQAAQEERWWKEPRWNASQQQHTEKSYRKETDQKRIQKEKDRQRKVSTIYTIIYLFYSLAPPHFEQFYFTFLLTFVLAFVLAFLTCVLTFLLLFFCSSLRSKNMSSAMHANQLKDPYYCPMCLLEYETWYPRRARTKRYAARELPHCHMSRYIERMVTYRYCLSVILMSLLFMSLLFMFVSLLFVSLFVYVFSFVILSFWKELTPPFVFRFLKQNTQRCS